MHLETKTSLLFAALSICFVIGCSRAENNGTNNTSSAPDMSAAKDMVATPSDMTPASDLSTPTDGAETTPSADMSADMLTADMPPARCADAPPCEQGAFHDRACECVVDMDRECETDADCRAEETCKAFPREGSDRVDMVCWFDESTLTVKKCPGAPGCEATEGELMAAARSMIVTPQGFETPTPAGLDEDGVQMTFNPPVSGNTKWNDCGYDGLCPGDEGYTAPDEGEGDGELQGMFLAGFSAGRPAQYCPEELIGCDRPECCVSKYAHDDIRVQIAVLRKGDLTVAFAALDAVGYFHTEIDEIRRRVNEEVDLDLLIMAATHSHEGPDTVGQWGPGSSAPMRPGRDAHLMESIKAKTVEGITQAVNDLAPAKVEASILDVGIEGLAMSDSRPPYIFDDNIPVVYLTNRTTGQPIATMLSVANHAEALWSRNKYISSDFFHFARKYVRDGLAPVDGIGDQDGKPALPGMGGVTVMFAGAVGGLINPGSAAAMDYAGEVFDEHGFAKADAIGQRIAMHVLEAKRDGAFTEVSTDEFSFATKRFLTPISNPIFILAGFLLELFERDIYNATRLSSTKFVPGEAQVMSQVAVVRLGPLSFFTAPGEVFPELLVGGYPGKSSTQDPVIGDIEGSKSTPTCGPDGLPLPENNGAYPCIVKFGQENPPDFSLAPDGPYVYDLVPGEYPFFIGLGMDFLGYMVPPYDYEPGDAPGSHYEETNGSSGELVGHWLTNLGEVLQALE